MASKLHLHLLSEGQAAWQLWREQHPGRQPNLREADLAHASLQGLNLRGAKLSGADLRAADLSGATLDQADLSGARLNNAKLTDANLEEAGLSGAHLSGAILKGARLKGASLVKATLTGAVFSGADLRRADLSDAVFSGADLTGADLTDARLYDARLQGAKLINAQLGGARLDGADLSDASLSGANLTGAQLCAALLCRASLTGANLTDANLRQAQLLMTRLERARLTGCQVYGIITQDVTLHETLQSDLIISPPKAPMIAVDHLASARLLELLINQRELDEAIETMTTRFVLILGRFTEERKNLLAALRDALRRRHYRPVSLDPGKVSGRELSEAALPLARIARFIIADFTDAGVLLSVMERMLPTLPSVPLQPLQQISGEPALSNALKSCPGVLPPYSYRNPEGRDVAEKIITSVEAALHLSAAPSRFVSRA
ncbi:MAG: pentapeptide repeat-containing protein [Blastocatellia bacterium]